MPDSMFRPSARMEAVQIPIIPALAALIKAHPGTISLGQGIVYYEPPPSAFAELARLEITHSSHQYGETSGLSELREMIAGKLSSENRMHAGTDRIIITAGANMGFLNALFAIADPGDEIILPLPYYFNHEMAVRMLNCRPVLAPAGENFQLCPEAVRKTISKKTRAVVTISPNNPSGAVYPEATLREVNHLCREHGIYHISDEAYEYFTFNGASHFSPGSIDGASRHTISLFSLSKAYGFASWRVGYMVIPPQLQEAVYKAQDTNLICATVAAQYAAIGAMRAGMNYCRAKLPLMAEIRSLMLRELEAITDICHVSPGAGAFYFLLKIKTGMDAMTLATRLIREHRVAAIPGQPFGLIDGCYLRVAYGALEKNNAHEGIRRLCHGLSSMIR